MEQRTVEHIETQLRKAIRNGDVEETLRLGADLDELTPPPPVPPVLGSALWYAERGIPVFPLSRMSKIPRKDSAGVHDATCDPDVIRSWWTDDDPHANIGVATGYRFDVYDIDGYDGVRTWVRIANHPHVFGRVNTPRPGGIHCYVATRDDRKNRAGLGPGLDYRGKGGYVVAPPSLTEQGRYTWVKPLTVEPV